MYTKTNAKMCTQEDCAVQSMYSLLNIREQYREIADFTREYAEYTI